jgi:uncharacterized membrane protein (DUF373 family)
MEYVQLIGTIILVIVWCVLFVLLIREIFKKQHDYIPQEKIEKEFKFGR